MVDDWREFGGYRIGSNIPIGQGAPWENVARVSRWGAPVIELNTSAEKLGSVARNVIKEQAKANNLVYTWHVPPDQREHGEWAAPNDPKQNEFARQVMTETIKAAKDTEARHITFHPTFAPRPAEGTMYTYDARTKQVGGHRLIGDLSKEDNIRLLDERARAEINTQLNRLESQHKMVSDMEETAKTVRELGVSDSVAWDMAYLVGESAVMSSAVGLQPESLSRGEWTRIQEKAARRQSLNDDEKQAVKQFSEKVLHQVGDYKRLFNSQIAELKPMTKITGPIISDGEVAMRQNVADNLAAMPKEALKMAVNNGISLGMENLPKDFLFGTPQELNDTRERAVKALVDSKKLSKAEAEQLIGFTFDFGHANTTKYLDIDGVKFAGPAEFIDQLKGPIKHVHATDSFGVVDGHLPLGQGEVTKQEFDKIKEALKRSGFKGTAIHELGASQSGALYQATMQFAEPGDYMVNGSSTSSVWGPSYVEAGMTDPFMLEKDKGYFYESFADVF
ncbi:MAG: TIM barrel protein [Candidatus Nanoarchaeia archaeon]|jgi:sugar phosphate isomerase/epimerase